MIVDIERGVVLLAVDAPVQVAELVARLQLHAAHLTHEALHMVHAVVGAHHLLVAEYGLRAGAAYAADALAAVHLEVVLAAENHLVFGEALLAELVQRRLAHGALQALDVPEPVEALEQVAVADGRVARGAQPHHARLLLLDVLELRLWLELLLLLLLWWRWLGRRRRGRCLSAVEVIDLA